MIDKLAQRRCSRALAEWNAAGRPQSMRPLMDVLARWVDGRPALDAAFARMGFGRDQGSEPDAAGCLKIVQAYMQKLSENERRVLIDELVKLIEATPADRGVDLDADIDQRDWEMRPGPQPTTGRQGQDSRSHGRRPAANSSGFARRFPDAARVAVDHSGLGG